MKADLHCHTVLSDGAMRVDQIIPYAKRIGLDYRINTFHSGSCKTWERAWCSCDSCRRGKRMA